MKLLFIHRSVGNSLIQEGNLRQKLESSNVELDDYDNNTGVLALANGSVSQATITIPGNNTNLENLGDYFSNWDELLDGYDVIAIKSCYPNSHVKDTAQLESIKQHYTTIFEAFRKHHKHLKLLTSPPLRPLLTNKREAALANELADWLLAQESDELSVLDFHRLLAESAGRHAGMLRSEYRRLLPIDTHPNKKANIEVSSKVAEFMQRSL